MANVLNGVETLPKISIAWVGCTNVTDDRQTDGRQHVANRELKTFAKNCNSVIFILWPTRKLGQFLIQWTQEATKLVIKFSYRYIFPQILQLKTGWDVSVFDDGMTQVLMRHDREL